MNGEIEKKPEQKNIKPTTMRHLIYGVMDKQKKALSLYEIRQQFDEVDRSTIFRPLKTFAILLHTV